MKKLIGLFVFCLCVACIDDAKQTNNNVASKEMEEKDPQQKEAASSALIPLVDFQEFNTTYLQQENDTTYVINFWATWCKPCVEELPAFEKINKEYADKKVKVVLASLDFPDRVEKQVIPFIKKYGLQSEIVLLDDPDANSWIPQVSEAWSGAIPATVIYNRQQRKFYEGSFTYEELNNEIKSILEL